MKILASDLDGTLVFKEREEKISKKDVQAIQSFQKEGNLFGVCTGRAVNRCVDIKEVMDCDFVIGTSGAHIVDKEGKTIYESIIPYGTIERLYNQFIENSIFICLQADGDGHFSKDVFGFQKTLVDVSDFKDSRIYGISITFESVEKAREINASLSKDYPEIHGHQNGCSIDITHKDCSKGNAVLKLKERYQADCLMAIGDSFNDISMIEAADIGYTFHSSKEDVKKVANQLVDHLYEAIQ